MIDTVTPQVFSLGSPHADDQIGWEVVRRLPPALASRCESEILASTWDLAPLFSKHRLAIIVDACISGRPAGTVFKILREELPSAGLCTSSHSGSLCDVLSLSESIGTLPEQLEVIGIEIATSQQSFTISDQVYESIPVVHAMIEKIILAWETRDDT